MTDRDARGIVRRKSRPAGVTARFAAILTLLCAMTSGCETVDDTRIPSLPVYIDLSDPGLWNTYGVSGFGSWNRFICQPGSAVEPSGFAYKDGAATGYGGVLLVEGMDPFELQTSMPLAYDLSCPIERSQTIRVAIDPETFEAVCPECHSHYDVTMGAGAPTAGPALTGSRQYGLRRYACHATALGGYIINDFK